MRIEKSEEKSIGYKELMKQKEYVKVIVANMISRLGDSIDVLAFTWLVYLITESAAWSALIFACNQLPSVLIQPFAGAWVERRNKKKIILITHIIRAGLVLTLMILYLSDCVKGSILLIFTLINSSVEAFALPASLSIIPRLVDKKYYSFALAANRSAGTAMELIGTGIGGIIIGILGIEAAVFFDSITFGIAAIILITINYQEDDVKKTNYGGREYFESLKQGFTYLKNQQIIVNLCVMAAVLNVIIVPVNALSSPLISEVMGQGSELLSVFSVLLTIGIGIGSWLYPLIENRCKVRNMITWAGILIGISFVLYTFGESIQEYVILIYLLTGISSFFVGLSVSIILTILQVQFVRFVKKDYLSRVGALFNAGASAATPIAAVTVSALSNVFDVATIFRLNAVFCVIIFCGVYITKVQFE